MSSGNTGLTRGLAPPYSVTTSIIAVDVLRQHRPDPRPRPKSCGTARLPLTGFTRHGRRLTPLDVESCGTARLPLTGFTRHGRRLTPLDVESCGTARLPATAGPATGPAEPRATPVSAGPAAAAATAGPATGPAEPRATPVSAGPAAAAATAGPATDPGTTVNGLTLRPHQYPTGLPEVSSHPGTTVNGLTLRPHQYPTGLPEVSSHPGTTVNGRGFGWAGSADRAYRRPPTSAPALLPADLAGLGQLTARTGGRRRRRRHCYRRIWLGWVSQDRNRRAGRRTRLKGAFPATIDFRTGQESPSWPTHTVEGRISGNDRLPDRTGIAELADFSPPVATFGDPTGRHAFGASFLARFFPPGSHIRRPHRTSCVRSELPGPIFPPR